MATFLLGSDPEFFIQSKEDGDVVPICGLIGGTKENPRPLGIGYVQEDNCAVEINTPPASSRGEWVRAILVCMEETLNHLKPFDFLERATHNFTAHQIIGAGERAMTFGCEPDFNAWDGSKNPTPIPESIGFRSAAGHVHVGHSGADENTVRLLDIHLALPALFLGDSLERRSLYGKAGAYRPKPYGIEYRVLSNFWTFSEELIEWVYDSVNTVLDLSGLDPRDDCDAIQTAVNTGDIVIAEQLMEKYNVELP